jgi:eukaryotic-like serine/threonine-protein kinase
LGRLVAIKILKPEVATNEQFAGRFLQEARSAAELHHKNIVEISDYGVDGDRPYMVMEYLEGESLGAYMKREGRLSAGRVVAIMEPVLRALSVAHERGIIHRDIKPDNIFLQRDEDGGEPTPKVVDFGIAKRQSNEDSPQLTTATMALGTPAYMSPEQIMSSKNATGAADQYAVGVTFYQALTGAYPFEATTINQFIVAKATQDPRSIGELRADLDPAFVAVIMRTLARKPEDRFPTIHALREALAPYRGSLADPPSQPAGDAAVAGSFTAGNRNFSSAAVASPVLQGTSSLNTPSPLERDVSDVGGSSRRLGVAVAALLALAAGGFAIARMKSSPRPEAQHVQESPTPAPRPADPPPPPGQRAVVFSIRVDPPSGAISLDGESLGSGRAEVMRPNDGHRYQLQIAARGYATITEVLTADRDVSIDRRLNPLTEPGNHGHTHAHALTPTVTPTPAPTVTPPPTPRAPTNNPRHPNIDRSNPFKGQ